VGLDGFHKFILKMMGHNRVFSFVRIIGIIISMKNVKNKNLFLEPVSALAESQMERIPKNFTPGA
jgi:hypothetical protein